jgi:hypothetical protein
MAFRNHSLNFDCRPANPSVSVSLQKVFKSKPLEMIKIGHEWGVTYNPKTGFFIDSVVDDGFLYYQCIGLFRNTMQTVRILINFIGMNF